MFKFNRNLPLSLYIHLPWCIQKCFYCDFNSHPVREAIPENNYIEVLLRDLEADLAYIENRELISIFIGGGTPSLFSPNLIAKLLQEIQLRIPCAPNIEITMEANPGTFEQQRFLGFYDAGINRLSIGCQSFQEDKLKLLGRIHGSSEALEAVKIAKTSGFKNINLDLMYGLPDQTLDAAIFDLQTAIAAEPNHISWYQLTLEPNTFFHRHPPALPDDELIWQMQVTGQNLLQTQGYQQYEISAYSRTGYACRHNLNYWYYGDYLGIGAGAHSKITDVMSGKILRFSKLKHPKAYLLAENFVDEKHWVRADDVPFEFFLNALRLNQAIPVELFEETTGISIKTIEKALTKVKNLELISFDNEVIRKTNLGARFLNNLCELFLPQNI